MINYHFISIHDFVQTHTSQMMSVSILVRMPAIYILRRERVIQYFSHSCFDLCHISYPDFLGWNISLFLLFDLVGLFK